MKHHLPLPVLDLRLHVVDRIRRLDLQRTGKGLDEDLHSTTETVDEMKGRLLLDVIIGKAASVFKLLSGEE